MSRRKSGDFRLKGGPTNTARGETLYVSVYCRGTIDAPHEKWRIASFRPEAHEGELFWTENESGYAEQGTMFRVYPPATQWLDGTQYIRRDEDGAAIVAGHSDAEVFYRDTFRVGWMLKCKRCGFGHKIGKPRDAYPLLTALAQNGIEEIPVREFCRRVVKQLD